MFMNSTGIVYLLTHVQLAARLVVSMYSLRRWYSGPITLLTTRPESHQIGKLCAAESRLSVNHQRYKERCGRGHVSSYLTKTALLRNAPYERNVFLDADTLVWSEIDELIAAAQANCFVVTGFCGGSTMNEPVRSRLLTWKALIGKADDSFQLEQRIEQLVSNPYPAVNAGVFSFRRKAKFTKRWDKLSRLGRKLPLPDEIAMQLMLPEVPHLFLGYQFNCHPFAYREVIGARIWHFAGTTHLLDGCRHVWLPVYQECVDKKVAQIDSWSKVGNRDRPDN